MNLIELIQSRRIALTPEYDAGWCAEVYDDQETVQYSGHGFTIDEAITDALGPNHLTADPEALQELPPYADEPPCTFCLVRGCNGECSGDGAMGG